MNWKKIKNISIDNEKYKENEKVYEYAIAMLEKDIRQGCEALYHNLNTLQSRSGQQLPFSSINYGTCTLTEGRMVINALLDCSLDGVGPNHMTPIFPCGIWQYMKGVNDKPGTPNYDLFKKALKSTSKRIYPNYCLSTWSNNDAGVKYSDEIKQKVIDNLSEEQLQKLIKFGKENPEIFEHYKLEIVKE